MNRNFFGDERDWFGSNRFGLFVHWGLYAIPGWHEQHRMLLGIPRDEYKKLMQEFNPVKFDPDTWLDIAESAGMKYITFTAKHLDGFCMWDTETTDFNVTNTPYRIDVLKTLADACHRRNFPLCIYYCITDNWSSHYPNQNRGHELPSPEPGDQPDLPKYVEYVKKHIEEICTKYGKIHGFWWDCNETEFHDDSINEYIRSLQPGIIINNRGFGEGDFSTPERDFDPSINQAEAYDSPVEACQSIGAESWGYRSDEDYFSLRFLTESIDIMLGRGGNYLLNVGPQADGTFSDYSIDLLKSIGSWYKRVEESLINVEATTAGEFATKVLGVDVYAGNTANKDTRFTCRDRTLYIHLTTQPIVDRVLIPEIKQLPSRCTLLNNGEEIRTSLDVVPSRHYTKGTPIYEESALRLCGLPVNRVTKEVIVIKLAF